MILIELLERSAFRDTHHTLPGTLSYEGMNNLLLSYADDVKTLKLSLLPESRNPLHNKVVYVFFRHPLPGVHLRCVGGIRIHPCFFSKHFFIEALSIVVNHAELISQKFKFFFLAFSSEINHYQQGPSQICSCQCNSRFSLCEKSFLLFLRIKLCTRCNCIHMWKGIAILWCVREEIPWTSESDLCGYSPTSLTSRFQVHHSIISTHVSLCVIN